MQIYSASPLVRIRQLVGDLVALAMIVIAVVLGFSTWAAIAAFGEFGRQVASAGAGLQSSMSDAADAVGGLPLVGEAASAPFQEASGVGAGLISTGEQQQSLAATVAIIAGLLVALIPIAIVLVVWLRRRVVFSRRAGLSLRLASTPGGTELLALRALSTSAAPKLLTVGPDPVGSWRAGDASAIRSLADLELRSAGVKR